TYEVGKTYHATIKANTNKQTYSFWITDEDNVTSLVAENFSYRNKTGSDLSKINIRGGDGIAAGLFSVENFTADYDCVQVLKAKAVNGAEYVVANFGDIAPMDLYVACYDENGGFLGAKKATVEIGNGGNAVVEAELPEDCAYVKLLTWNNGTPVPMTDMIRRTAVKF
ncbi:MAG: hypothetical protein ACI4SS_05975, partial [Clostridia bacterium]